MCQLILSDKKSAMIFVIVLEWIIFAVSCILFILFLIYHDTLVEHIVDRTYKADSTYYFRLLVAKDVTEAEAIGKQMRQQLRESVKTVLYIYTIVFIVTLLARLGMLILLTVGVKLRKLICVNIWYILTMILFILGILGICLHFIQLFGGRTTFLNFFLELTFICWMGFSLYIVKRFKRTFDSKVVSQSDDDNDNGNVTDNDNDNGNVTDNDNVTGKDNNLHDNENKQRGSENRRHGKYDDSPWGRERACFYCLDCLM